MRARPSPSRESVEARLGLVGAGQMARALASGLVSAELLPPAQITAFDPSAEALAQFSAAVPGAGVARGNADIAAGSDVIVLAVKPQQIETAMQDLRAHVAGKLFISIAAGVSLARLASGLGTERLARVMPNTPCLVGQGASGYALGRGATESDGRLVGKMFSSIGLAFELKENLLDAVTGLSGSGPAYVFTIIEALSDGGVRAGLPREVATALAAQTVLGSAQMVLETGEHPAALKDRVTSPAGTTIAGLAVLEDRGLRGALISAVEAAAQRSRELGGQPGN